VRRGLRTRLLAVLIGGVLAAGCSSAEVGPRIPSASTPDTAAEPPIVTAAATTTTSAGSVAAAPADLRELDWAKVPIPGAFCGVPGLVRLEDNPAKATSDTWGPVHLYRSEKVVYGDVKGDRRSEAAVGVDCNNGGGTAAGQLAFAFVVFEGVRGRLVPIGTITPRKNPPNQLPTVLSKLELQRGRITAHEAWYRPSDSTCCPTGTAVTTWTVKGDHLVPGAPHITS
jgi:hypothetical protein